GGLLGPDRSPVGSSRTVDSLIDSVRRPNRRLAWGLTEPTKEFAHEYETVTVTTADMQEITGVTLNEDQFTIQMMDRTEHVRFFDKDKLHSLKKSRASLMPPYPPRVLSDDEMHDILAYLVSGAPK